MKNVFRAFVALTLVFANVPARAADQEITVLAWGFAWDLGLRTIADDFTKETGIKVNQQAQAESTAGLVKIQAMKDNPTIDVWFTTSSLAARAQKDTALFANIPHDQITNGGKLIGGAQTPSYVAAYYYPLSILYRPDLVKTPITAWGDLWGPELKNKIAAPSMGFYPSRLLIIASILHGGSLQNVDPGFAALKTLSPNVALWYTSDTDARKAFAQGEASVLVGPPAQAKSLEDDGIKVTVLSPKPTPVMFDVMMAVNTPRKGAAIRFIDYVVSAKAQAIIAESFNCGPVNNDTKISASLAAAMPTAENQVSFDESIVNDNISAWRDRFDKEIAH